MTDKFFLQDKAVFRKYRLLQSDLPLDATLETKVSGFQIGGVQPVGSRRKFIFKIDDELFYFIGSNLVTFPYPPTAKNILLYGNDAQDLTALNNIPDFCGKFIYPIIALDWSADSAVEPSVELAIEVSSVNDIFSKTFYSPVYKNEDGFKLGGFAIDCSRTGNASYTPQVRYLIDNVWSDWSAFGNAQFKNVDAFQLRIITNVTTLSGTDSVSFSSITANFSDSKNPKTVKEFAICFNEIDAGDNLGTAYLFINHNYLEEKNLQAYVAFAPPTEFQEVDLGFATGQNQSYTFTDTAVDFNSIQLLADDKNIFDFAFDSSTNSITFNAPQGAALTLSYNFNYPVEDWQEMELQFTAFNENFGVNSWCSRFAFWLDTIENSQLVKLKIVADSGVEIYSCAAAFAYD